MALSRGADRLSPYLFGLFLIALPFSISAAQIALGLLAFVTLCRLADPEERAAFRFPLLAPLLAYAGVTLLSAALSSAPLRGFHASKDLLLIATFFLAVNTFGGQRRTIRLLGWFFGSISMVSVHGLLQIWACRSAVIYPGWVEWALRVKLETCRAVPLFRAKGFYSIYMTYAGVLLLALTLMLGLLALLPWRETGRVTGAALLTTLALGATFVRNAWVGLVVSFLALFALTRRVRLLGLALVPVILLLLAPGVTMERLKTIADPTDATTRDRLDFWRAGAAMVRARPLLGVGPGNVRLVYPEYRPPDARRPSIGHLHNNVIQIAAERGILGLSAWLWIWAAFLTGGLRVYLRLPSRATSQRALVAGSLAASLAFFVAGLFEYSFGDSEVQMLLWVVLALPFVVDRWPAQP